MKTRFVILLLVVAAVTAVVLSQAASEGSDFGTRAPATVEQLQPSPVERGRYLVSFAMCDDCHTPKTMGPDGPELDLSRRLSGHPESAALPPAPILPEGPWIAVGAWDLTAWAGPWGTSYAINLTPDENTGIGIWTEEMFIQALRTGRHMGQSRPILPPMPWQFIRNMNDEDLEAVYAFLRSLPPIHNRVPEPLPPPGQEEEDPFLAGP